MNREAKKALINFYKVLATEYGKGAHSFKILERIDAKKVLAASPSAQRLIDELDKVL